MIVKTAANANNITMKGQVMLKAKKHKCLVSQWLIFCILASFSPYIILVAKEKDFIYFDTQDVGQPDSRVPLINPGKPSASTLITGASGYWPPT